MEHRKSAIGTRIHTLALKINLPRVSLRNPLLQDVFPVIATMAMVRMCFQAVKSMKDIGLIKCGTDTAQIFLQPAQNILATGKTTRGMDTAFQNMLLLQNMKN